MSQTTDRGNPPPKLITVQKFKDDYGVSHTTAYRLFKDKVETVKVGRATRVVRESADNWLASLRNQKAAA